MWEYLLQKETQLLLLGAHNMYEMRKLLNVNERCYAVAEDSCSRNSLTKIGRNHQVSRCYVFR